MRSHTNTHTYIYENVYDGLTHADSTEKWTVKVHNCTIEMSIKDMKAEKTRLLETVTQVLKTSG